MTKEEIAQKYIPCRCDDVYKSRGLIAPDCPYHSTDPELAMDEYAKQQAIAFHNYLLRYAAYGDASPEFLYDLFIEQQNKPQ